jgi:hypothetical protein
MMKNLSLKWNRPGSLLRLDVALFAVSCALILVMLILTLINPLRVNRDASLHLLIGELLLRGAVPYVDYVEINPPLVHYLHVIPVAIARWIGVNPIPVFLLLIQVLSVWSIAVGVYLLARNAGAPGLRIGAVMALSTTVLDLKLFTVNEFGQREHIFFLLVMPYVILRWLRWRGRLTHGSSLGIIVGLAAGVGAYIKPHFLLILLALEVFWSVVEGRGMFGKGPEVLAVVGLGLGYALWLLLMPQEMRAGLIAVVQSVLSGGYRAYGDRGAISLILDQNILLLFGLVPFLFFRLINNADEVESMIQSMSVFTLSALVVYGLQGRGFAYHLIPAMGSEYLVAFLVILVVAPRVKSVVWTSGMRTRGMTLLTEMGWLLTMLVALIAVGKWIGDLSPNAIRGAAFLEDAGVIQAIKDNSSMDDSVLVVSTMAEPFRLVLQADRRLASKYIPTNPISFGISGIDDTNELYDPDFRLPDLVQGYLDELEASILRERPAMIIVDNRTSCVGCPQGFQVSEFLQARGVLDRVIRDNYTELVDSERFVIWKRLARAPAQ